MLVSWGCLSKVPQTGCLKQQGFIDSQFCRLEVQDESAGSLGFSWTRRRPSSPCFSVWSSLSVHVCALISSSYNDTSCTGQGPILVTSFYLGHVLKSPSHTSCTLEGLGFTTSTCESVGQASRNNRPGWSRGITTSKPPLETPLAAEVENHGFRWVCPSIQEQLFGISSLDGWVFYIVKVLGTCVGKGCHK